MLTLILTGDVITIRVCTVLTKYLHNDLNDPEHLQRLDTQHDKSTLVKVYQLLHFVILECESALSFCSPGI